MKHNHPLGFHCRHFDTDLLEQIVAVEVDIAVRRLARDAGMIIDHTTQAAWNIMVLDRIQRHLLSDASSHCLLPQVVQERLMIEMNRIIDEETRGTPVALPEVSTIPASLPYRLMFFLQRLFFEKPLE